MDDSDDIEAPREPSRRGPAPRAPDPLKSALRWLPLLLVIAGLIGGGYLGEYRLGLLERRVDAFVDRLDAHERLDGHAVGMARVAALERQVEKNSAAVDKVLDELVGKLDRLNNNTTILCAKIGARCR